jgi:hypothetical protein
MWFENVFFNTRPIVLSLARSTIFSSTTLSSSSANVQRDRPLGGSEQASAISLASAAPFQHRSFVLAQTNNVLLDRNFRHVPIPGISDDAARESENQLKINDGRH